MYYIFFTYVSAGIEKRSDSHFILFFFLKYIPANRFKYIVKDVHRQRCREEEENIWASFVKQQELNGYNKNGMQPSVQNIKQLLDEGMKEANKELKRLETDILPDKIKDCSKTGNNQKKRLKVRAITICENNAIRIYLLDC